MTLDQIGDLLKNGDIPDELVDELLEAYQEAKDRFASGDHRPQRIEGGRFGEATFRILQHETSGTYTPIGTPLPRTDDLIRGLENLQRAAHSDAIRVHIPRTLRLIYDIRSRRDVAHLGPVDAGLQDSTLVVHCMDWVLAELVREEDATITPEEAQRAIEGIVAKEIPAIQEFDGEPFVLRDLRASDLVLVLLYHEEPERSGFQALRARVRPQMRANLRRTMDRLVDEFLVHHTVASDSYRITRNGQQRVLADRLLH